MARAATTSDAFNAIAEPQRREILVRLRDGEQAVGDLALCLGMSQPQASKHLKVLREVGLVRVRGAGKQRIYALDFDGLRPVQEWLGGFEQSWNESFDRLGGMPSTSRGFEKRSDTMNVTADREVESSHVIDAPREAVFEAFTDVRHLSQWWGPRGFTTTTRSFEFRVGGEWSFMTHGPYGTHYPEWIVWRGIAPPERIAMLHGEFRDDPNAFESLLVCEEEQGCTRVTMRTVFPTKELRDEAVEKYHAIEGGKQTLQNLDRYVVDRGRSARG